MRQHRWFKLNLFTLTSPAWMTHVLGPTFLHQDMVLLHQQEKIIAQGDGQALADKWKDQVFIPTSADKMTVMFYQWFGRHGPVPWQGPEGADQMPPIERDQSKLFDTWEMHTKYCTHCQGALRNTEILKWVAVAGAAFKAVWVACGLAFAASAAGAAGTRTRPRLRPLARAELGRGRRLQRTVPRRDGVWTEWLRRDVPLVSFSHAEEDTSSWRARRRSV